MLMLDPSQPPLGPSEIPYPGGQTPRALTITEIEEIVEAFGAGARRARDAGFDAVEVHGGHGYLIAQFMSSYFNRRTDRYGGDLLGRLRFATEVLRQVRADVGEDFPVIFRFSGDERVPDGRSAEESAMIAPLLVEAGADCLSVTTGMHFTLRYTVAPMGMPKGLNVDSAAAVKAAVDVPVMAVGRLNDPVLAEGVLRDGKADLIGIGRGLIADPELPLKLGAGRREDIRWCIACNQGCIGAMVVGDLFKCLVNPEAGREGEMRLEPASTSKRVLVAGGGPAGLEAARVAALRGHKVTLYERSERLGGQFYLASLPPRKQDIAAYLAWAERQLDQAGVAIVKGQTVSAATVTAESPNVFVVATGSVPQIPAIPGIDGDNVVTAPDVLNGTVTVGERVVVAGGGQVGCETAEFLDRLGKKVTVVEARQELAPDETMLPRASLLDGLARTSVETMTSTRLVEIMSDAVVVERDGVQERLEGIDSVVLALGVTPASALAEAIGDTVSEAHVIGDASTPSNAMAAILAGAEVGRKI
jgi:NADPH-dependent 2,4-dienoyl-CoA reductase/sulfur reductase-like enzyme